MMTKSAAHLLEEARRRLGNCGSASTPRSHQAVNFYQQGLEQHHPEAGRYDVIWLQWAALYLTDGKRMPTQRYAPLLQQMLWPLLSDNIPVGLRTSCPAAVDLIAFLQRSASSLKAGGVLFVKENVTDKGFIVDNSDASVTRHALPAHVAQPALLCATQRRYFVRSCISTCFVANGGRQKRGVELA